MDEFNVTIEYCKENSEEVLEKEICVDLNDYQESYADDAFHLGQQYTPSQVEKYTEPLKKEFLLDLINEKLGDGEVLYGSNVKPLIKEIDEYISELQDEYASDEDDDDDD